MSRMCSDGEHVVASGVDVPTRLLSDIRLGILGMFSESDVDESSLVLAGYKAEQGSEIRS